MCLRNFDLLTLNFLPNDKMIDWTRFKAFADENLNVGKMAKFAFDMFKNIVGKGGYAGHQHFLLFPQCFQKVKTLDYVVKG